MTLARSCKTSGLRVDIASPDSTSCAEYSSDKITYGWPQMEVVADEVSLKRPPYAVLTA